MATPTPSLTILHIASKVRTCTRIFNGLPIAAPTCVCHRKTLFWDLGKLLNTHKAGHKTTFRFFTAFGCPFEGAVDELRLQELSSQVVDLGARHMTLCDTAGMAHQVQVQRVFEQAMGLWPAVVGHDIAGQVVKAGALPVAMVA